jgi:nitrite reductase (NADH) large subunit
LHSQHQAEVVKDPKLRAQFKQFANTNEVIGKDDMIEFVDMRGQIRPADWPKDGEPQTMWKPPTIDIFSKSQKSWVHVGSTEDFLPNVGTPILYGDSQLAIFNNQMRGEWYCTQNMCPHKQAFVLSQGIIGATADDVPKVACPLHKKSGLPTAQEDVRFRHGTGNQRPGPEHFDISRQGGRQESLC